MTDKTRDEVNRYLHEKRGLCWHEPEGWHCIKCGGNVHDDWGAFGDNPDYCSDDSARSLLNEVVAMVTENTPFPYLDALKRTTNAIDRPFNATAEMIARACVEAWEARDGK